MKIFKVNTTMECIATKMDIGNASLDLYPITNSQAMSLVVDQINSSVKEMVIELILKFIENDINDLNNNIFTEEQIKELLDLGRAELKSEISDENIRFLIKNKTMIYVSPNGEVYKFIIDKDLFLYLIYIGEANTQEELDECYNYNKEN